MTEDSLSKSAEMQDRLTEAHEQHQKLVKKVQSAEESKRKMKYELQQVQMKVKWGGRKRERERERGRKHCTVQYCETYLNHSPCILLFMYTHTCSWMTVPMLVRNQML